MGIAIRDIGTAAVAAFVGRLAAVPEIRRITAATGVQNTASRAPTRTPGGSNSRARFRAPAKCATH